MDSTEAFFNRLGRRNTVLILCAVIIAAVLIVFACFALTFSIAEEVSEDEVRDLDEISLGVADTVNARIEAVLDSLGSIGLTYIDPEEQDMDHPRYLKQKSTSLGYEDLAVVDERGRGINADGEEVDLSELPGIQKAIAGQPAFSNVDLGSPSEDSTLYCAAPLVNEQGEVVGAVASFNPPSRIRAYLNVVSFRGEGYSELIDQNGDYIVASDNKNSPSDPTNFFDMIETRGSASEDALQAMEADVSAGRSGVLEYQLDGVDMVVSYRPLDVPNVYLMTAVPLKALTENFSVLSTEAIASNIFIVVVLVLLIAFILLLNKRQRKNLEKVAFVDPVTDGHNKTWFLLEAGGRIKEAPAGSYTLISVDVQKFKLINDIFGIDQGDRALRHIYGNLEEHFGREGLVCRYAADQFSILIDAAPSDAILQKVDQVCNAINAFNENTSDKYYLTLSFGVVEIDDPELPLALIQDRADTARKNRLETIATPLYTCTFYTDFDRQRMLEEKEMENNMEEALKNGEFVMYLQPKVGLKDRKVVGAEALVRWAHPSKGLMPPDLFIPLFEKNGFIVDLDRYMFEQVCSTLRRWIDEGRQPVAISVNLSRVHLRNSEFLNPYIEIRDRFEIPSELIEFEFTESLVFDDFDMVLHALTLIHQEGFRCAIDDFGSGYSSFNMLKDFAADVLKIDRTFFSQDEDGERERSIVEAIVSLAKRLNMTTVAEGVEHEVTLEYLLKAGCDAVQGYVFSRPLPLGEFEAFAQSSAEGL